MLERFLEQQPSEAFSWSSRHCAHFGAQWVRELRGVDPLPDWATSEGATARSLYRRAQKEAGGLPEAVTKFTGVQPRSAAFARLGDLVLLPTGQHRGALGVCAGRKSAFLGMNGGIIYHPTSSATLCWPL